MTVHAAPQVSLVMPVYNGEPHLAAALKSVLAQTHGDFELLVIDAASTDGTRETIRAFAARDHRIRPMFLPFVTRGRALNEGAAAARGRWFGFLHADNVALPHSLEAQLDFMRRTGVDVCGGWARRIGAGAGTLERPASHAAICQEMFFSLAVLPMVLMSRHLVRSHPFDETVALEDYELYTRIASICRMGNVQEVLFELRMHPQQASVRERDRVSSDESRLRQRYFQSVFPELGTDDYAPLDTLAARKPFADLDTLQRGGQWLCRLLEANPDELAARFARRWHECCMRSAAAGLNCHRLFADLARRFGLPTKEDVNDVRSTYYNFVFDRLPGRTRRPLDPTPRTEDAVPRGEEEDGPRVSERGRRLAVAYAQRQPVMPVLPVYLDIETTSHCNLACVMCPQPRMERRRQHMDDALFTSIIRQGAGHVDFAWLHLFGEPLLHPRFLDLVSFAREHGAGMKLGASTNVTLLRGRILDAAVALPLDVLLLSVDGISAPTYERIRVRGDFSRVVDQVCRFADRWIGRPPAQRPRYVVLSFIDLPCIPEDVAAARAFWAERLPPQFAVHLKPFHPWGNQPGLIADIRRSVGDFRALTPRRRRCHEFSRGLTVLSDGRVVPCCNDYEGVLVLGDLNRDSLADVWNSSLLQRLRVDDRLDNDLCRFCPQNAPLEADALLDDSPFQVWQAVRRYMV